MRTLRLVLLYLLAAVIVIILGGFVGWYFFLHVPQTKEAVVDAARGLSSSPISFTGGSTQKNINAVIAGGEIGAGADAIPDASSSRSRLWQVDKTPVAGMGFVKNATTSALEYVERANGYVFAADAPQRSTIRLTETLLPKIYEALLASDGSIIERSVDDTGSITTFIGALSATTSTSTTAAQNVLRGAYITKDIRQIAINPTTKSLFYLAANGAGGIDAFTAQGNGSKPKKVFSSTLAHWTPLWLSDGRLIITESPADDLPGYSYSVGNDGAMTLLLGNVPGLTFLPRTSSKAILYGASSNATLALFAQGGASSTPASLGLQTVADKCVWLEGKSLIAYCAVPTTPPSGRFLDLWYRGAVHTSDDWWKIDVQNGVTTQMYSPKKTDGADIDVEHPIIDPTGNYIAFINASDKSLWMLNIPQ